MICIGLDNVGLSFGTDVVFEKVSFLCLKIEKNIEILGKFSKKY